MADTNITTVKGYTFSGTYQVKCELKPEKGSTEVKKFKLNFVFENVPLKDIVTRALSSARISWQNSHRSKFDHLVDGSSYTIDFSTPGKKIKTQEEKIAEAEALFRAAGLDKQSAHDMAVKAVTNPEILED